MVGSLNAYARHRKSLGLIGGSLAAVQKARDTKRIVLRPDGQIDFETADSDWAKNSNRHQQRPKRVSASAEKPPVKAVPEIDSESFLEAQKTARMGESSRSADGAQKNARVKLLEGAIVEFHWADVGSRIQNAIMGIPARMVNRLPLEWRREVLAVAQDEVRAILKALSDELRRADPKAA